MNAIEFVKEYGIDAAKGKVDFLENRSRNKSKTKDQFLIDLKQIIDAFDIVNALGGLHMAKADAMDLDGFEKDSPYWIKVKKAINLVKQCQ